MQKKARNRKYTIVGLAILIAIMILYMLNGDRDTRTVVMVNKDIDLSKSLDSQLGSFYQTNISKKDFDKMHGTVVTSLKDIEKAEVLLIPLKQYSIVPKSALSDSQGSELASKIDKNKTWYRFQDLVTNLPPDIKVGDKVDVNLLRKEKNSDIVAVNTIYKDVKITFLNEKDVFVEVSTEDFKKLNIYKEMGDFVLTLKGQKVGEKCKKTKDCTNNGENYTSDKLLDELNKATSSQANVNDVYNNTSGNVNNTNTGVNAGTNSTNTDSTGSTTINSTNTISQ